MQEQKYLDIWDRICDQIRSYDEVDNSQFNAFFSRLHLQAISDGFIMITADNSFIKTYIEHHYLNYLDRALTDLYHSPYTISLEVDETPQAPAPQPSYAPPTTQTQEIQSAPVRKESSLIPSREDSHISLERPSSRSQQLSRMNPYEKTEREDQGREELRKQSNPTPPSRSIVPSLTFENYVIGESNRMAYQMALAVAEDPGKPQWNPLFLYGKSGLGKTHLLRAIQNYIETSINGSTPEDPSLPDPGYIKTIYVDSAEFLNDYTDASIEHSKEKESFKNFKKKYEEADVLLIDDVQVLQDKPATLEMIFEIFKKFIDQGKQVVLSADTAPKNIDIDERYQSRFNSGATFDIQPPEFETKLAIIKNFIDGYKQTEQVPDLEIPREIQIYIAENAGSNIRELKSAIGKVIFQIQYNDGGDMSVEDAARLLENHFSGGATKRLTIPDIQKQVENFYKVSHSDLVSKKQTRAIVYPRQMAMYLCREMLDKSYAAIGQEFGNKDHTTVLYAINNIREKMKVQKEIAEEIDIIKKKIRDE